jgi:hypothetical protein
MFPVYRCRKILIVCTLFFTTYSKECIAKQSDKSEIKTLKDFAYMLDEKNEKNNEVLKPSGAIQIIVTDNKKLSLLQRKAWNILILNASNDLELSQTYKIEFNTICSLLRNNDVSSLKKDLLKLMSTTVQFNYLKTRDKSEWKVDAWEASTLLADAKIEDNELSYSFGPMMRQKLSHLELYARINLSIQRNIDSKYSLILYELAKDHFILAQGRGLTPFIGVDELKRLMECHDEQSYVRFAEFNRVIKKAIKEINEKTDIEVSAIYKRRGKRVVSIQFQVKRKKDKSGMLEGILGTKQKDLPMEGSDLYNKLVNEYGISPKQAAEFVRDYPEEYILGKMIYTTLQFSKGKIKETIPGFLYRAIKEDYKDTKIQVLPSALPLITPGMKIDIGGGEIFTVTEEKYLKNSKNQIFALENEIRLNLAAGKYFIVDVPVDITPIPDIETKPANIESVPEIVEKVQQAEQTEPDLSGIPEIKAGMKIDLGGVVFTVAEDKTIKNTHGRIIFTTKQLLEHLARGDCFIIEDETSKETSEN